MPKSRTDIPTGDEDETALEATRNPEPKDELKNDGREPFDMKIIDEVERDPGLEGELESLAETEDSEGDQPIEASFDGPQGRNTALHWSLYPRGSANISCPFRKRNPLRFNVRNYETCASRGFSDMAVLK